jgi:hypothetical protein
MNPVMAGGAIGAHRLQDRQMIQTSEDWTVVLHLWIESPKITTCSNPALFILFRRSAMEKGKTLGFVSPTAAGGAV